jgi:hypothetical protein
VQTVVGLLVTSLLSWAVILPVGFVVFGRIHPTGDLNHISRAIEEGAKTVIRRMLKISTPAFVIFALVFLAGTVPPVASHRLSIRMFFGMLLSSVELPCPPNVSETDGSDMALSYAVCCGITVFKVVDALSQRCWWCFCCCCVTVGVALEAVPLITVTVIKVL